eukprot:2846059-Alexandrium_andersonii.AAC.1
MPSLAHTTVSGGGVLERADLKAHGRRAHSCTRVPASAQHACACSSLRVHVRVPTCAVPSVWVQCARALAESCS